MPEDYVTDFFGQNSKLFTILGVFGAISVYFTQLDLDSRWRRLGIVSSLTIFIVVAISIQRNLPPEESEAGPFDYIVNNPRENKSLVIYYVAFWAVVLSVAAIVLRFSNTFIFLVQFQFIILGIYLIVRWVDLIEVDDDVDLTIGESPAFLMLAAYVMRNAIWGGTVGGGILALLWTMGFVPVNQLIQFQLDSILAAPIFGILGGMALGGILYTGVTILMIIAHFMLAWIIENGLEEEFAAVMNTYFGWDEPDSETDPTDRED